MGFGYWLWSYGKKLLDELIDGPKLGDDAGTVQCKVLANAYFRDERFSRHDEVTSGKPGNGRLKDAGEGKSVAFGKKKPANSGELAG
jgi:hypothetical protein